MSQDKVSTAAPKLPEPPPDEKTPFCIVAKHHAKPERAADMEKRIISMAKLTRKESGALAFHVHRDRSDKNLYVIYEMWQDVDALKKHFTQDYVQDWLKDMPNYLTEDLEVEWLIMMAE